MSEFGLTNAGFVAPKSSDFEDMLRADFETEVDKDIDWARQTVLGPLIRVVSRRMGSAMETVVALRDSRSLNNATGVQLDDLAQLSLTARDPATRSTVNLVLTSTSDSTVDIFVEQGWLASGGGDDGRARWRTTEAATLPAGGGNITIAAEAAEKGAVAAAAGDITKILTPLEGLASVNNPADAVLGRDVESHAALRRRIPEAPYRAGLGNAIAVRERVRNLDFITVAHVLENDTSEEVTIDSVAMKKHSLAVIVYPDTLTTEQEETLAAEMFEAKGGGIRLNGDQSATITLEEIPFTVRWLYATTVAVTVEVDVTLAAGFDFATDIEEGVEDVVADYFAELLPGQDVLRKDLLCRIDDEVDGLRSIEIRLNASAADLVVDAIQIATLSGTATVAEV